MTPEFRLNFCRDFVVKQFHSGEMADKNRPFLAEFEINVDSNLMKVNSVVIPPPTLQYSKGKHINPNRGEWEMFRERACFYKPAR